MTPDLLVTSPTKPTSPAKTIWVEAKTKTGWSPSIKMNGLLMTGMEEELFDHYMRVDRETPWRVWVMFLHKKQAPRGLFARDLYSLSKCIDARWDGGGRKKPMVYWSVFALKRLDDSLGGL